MCVSVVQYVVNVDHSIADFDSHIYKVIHFKDIFFSNKFCYFQNKSFLYIA